MTTEQSEAGPSTPTGRIDTIKELALAYSSVDQALQRINRLSRAFPEMRILTVAAGRLEEVKSILTKGKL